MRDGLCRLIAAGTVGLTLAGVTLVVGPIPAFAADTTDASCFDFDSSSGSILGYDDDCGADVVIPDAISGVSVTSIAADAFAYSAATSVVIPATVTTIEDDAFYLAYLETLTFATGSQLVRIGAHAFDENFLATVDIPATVTSIGDDAFYYNYIDSVQFAQGSRLVEIGAHAFDANLLGGTLDLSALQQLTGIGDYAFAYGEYDGSCGDGEHGIREVRFPESVTTIGSGAFTCNAIDELDLPASLQRIGSFAFDTNALSGEVRLPAAVTTVEGSAFTANPLEGIVRHPWQSPIPLVDAVDPGVEVRTDTTIRSGDYPSTLSELVIPDGVTGIADGAFAHGSLTSVVLPDTLDTIGDDAFLDNRLSGVLVVPASVTEIGAHAFGSSTDPLPQATERNQLNSLRFDARSGQTLSIGAGAFADNALTGALDLPAGVVLAPDAAAPEARSFLAFDVDPSPACTAGGEIDNPITAQAGVGAFQDNDLSSVVIPSDVTSIPDQAFHDSGITSLSFAPGRTSGLSIGVFAFSDNEIAGALQLPDDVTWSSDSASTVPGYAAFDDNRITALGLGDGITCLPDFAFEKNLITGALAIPDTVTTIGLQAFNENRITSVEVPSSVTHIGYFGFGNNCLGDTVPASATECSGVQGGPGLVFEDGGTSLHLDTSAFDGNDLASVALPTTTPTDMFGYVFYANPRLTTVDLGNAVGDLGKNIFSDDSLTGTLTIPAGVTGIGDAAFARNDIDRLIFAPGSRLTTINQYAFDKNSISGTIDLPAGVTSIGYMAFFANEISEARVPSALRDADVGGAAFGLQTSTGGKALTDRMNETLADSSDTAACAAVRNALEGLVYTRLYTVDALGAVVSAGLSDELVSETSASDYVGDSDCSGDTDGSLGGALVNPVSAEFHYVDDRAQVLRDPDTMVGQLPDGTSIGDYSAPGAAPEDYFRFGETLVYRAPEIDGYTTPSAGDRTFSLGATNRLELTYALADDGDGVSPETEAAGPNSGDGNDDGLPDDEQPNVVSFPDAAATELGTSDAYTTLAVQAGCTLSGVASGAVPSDAPDPGYRYDAGLVDFTADCGTPGGTVEVTLYVYGIDPGAVAVRKFDRSSASYTTVTGASVTRGVIGGDAVSIVRYDLVDGGPLDSDGAPNGRVVDPVGLAIPVVGSGSLPDTGFTPAWWLTGVAMLLLLGGAVLRLARRRPRDA